MRKVFLEDLPRYTNGKHKGKIKWSDCIGYKVKFVYYDIQDEFEITNVNLDSRHRVELKYNDKKRYYHTGNVQKCDIGVLIGKRNDTYKYNIGDIITDVKSGKLKIMKTSRIKESRSYYYKCLECGNNDEIREYNLDKKSGCNVCGKSPKKVKRGFNDLWTTNPEIAGILEFPEIGYEVSSGSNKKENFKCPNCNHVSPKNIASIVNRGFSCPRCSDGLSYPEKFMISMLDQLNLEYEKEKTFKWTENITNINPELNGTKRYDFYIKNSNCIIEMHGSQHYTKSFHTNGGRTLDYEDKNDKLKMYLAIKNGITDYIVINCNIVDMEYIKNNIMKSNLSELFCLFSINWLKCHEFACNSLVKDACNLWNDGNSALEISNILKMNRNTIVNYLKQGAKLGWSDYDPKIVYQKTMKINHESNRKKIAQLSKNGELIRFWGSIQNAMDELKIERTTISKALAGVQKSAGGFIWTYREEYENNKNNEITPYINKTTAKCIVMLDLNGNFLKEYDSITNAHKDLGILISNIASVCKGNRKSAGGFKWMYKEDYEKYISQVHQ